MKDAASVIALIEASLRGAPPEAMAFFRGERDAARQALAAGRSPADVAAMTTGPAERLDALVHDLVQERPPACAQGCACCCHGLKVDVSAPEAVAIAEFLRGLTPEELAQTCEQMAEEAAYARTLDVETRWREQTACAFLEDDSGECVIYDVRPFACRAHTSMSLEQCERAAADPKHETAVDKHFVPASIFGMAKSAILVACHEAGLDARGFELTNAVAVALNEPGAAERWGRGDPVFDAAVIPSDEHDAEVALGSLARFGLLPPERLLKRPSSQAERNAAKRARKAGRAPGAKR